MNSAKGIFPMPMHSSSWKSNKTTVFRPFVCPKIFSVVFAQNAHFGGIGDKFHIVALQISLGCPKWLWMGQRYPCLWKHTKKCPTSYLVLCITNDIHFILRKVTVSVDSATSKLNYTIYNSAKGIFPMPLHRFSWKRNKTTVFSPFVWPWFDFKIND